ncbi:MAG: hypothetical protein NVSMB4_13010 [Acidimicrobiales bacterium]
MLAPFAMRGPLARSDYYGASAPPHAFGRRRAYPATPNGFPGTGTVQDGSRVHCEPIDQVGTQLCPGSIATTTPQTFTVASPPARQAGYGVDHPHRAVVHCTPAHIRQI